MPPEQLLDYERLDVYHLARDLAREGCALLKQVPSGRAEVIDQFRRAVLSVSLNIAEGAGEFAPREKARFYRIAKRSGTECGALLDHLVDLHLLTERQTEQSRALIRRITGGLVRLIQATERTARRSGGPAPSPARKPASASAPSP